MPGTPCSTVELAEPVGPPGCFGGGEPLGELEVEVAPEERVEHVVGRDRRAGLGRQRPQRGEDPRPGVDEGHVEIEPDDERLHGYGRYAAHRSMSYPGRRFRFVKTRTVHRCTECGGESPRWLGRCPVCTAWGTLVEEVDLGGAAAPPAALRTSAVEPVPIAQVDARDGAAALDGGRRARPRARRRARPRVGHAPGRRAGDGEEHAPAAGARPHGGAGGSQPARHRRGVVRAGAHARRSGWARSMRACWWWPRPRCPTCSRTPRRWSPTCWRWTPSRPWSIPISRAHPGSVTQVARLRLPAGAAGQGAGPGDGAGGPRHQGGDAGRSARPRARRRHRALVRRRPRPDAAYAPRAQAPLREHGRGGPVRDDRARPGRRARRVGPVPRGSAPRRARLGRGRRSSRGRARSWSRSRRWSFPPRPRCRADPPRAWSRAAWRCCWRSSSGTRR